MKEITKENVLLYHAKCPDGFGAAYSFWKTYGDNMDYYPITHGDPLPDLTDKTVYMADIALSKEETVLLRSKAKNLQILDHHISRYDDLKDLSYYHFDNEHSGAILAWKYLNPDKEPPLILKYIEARDIWKWDAFPNANNILCVLDSIGYSFEEWDSFSLQLEEDASAIERQGIAILRYCDNLMSMMIKDKYTISIKGYDVPIINISFFKSEILNKLCFDQPFAAGYHYDGEVYRFSLRSKDDGVDVSKIAAMFGGGGHRNAAGFIVRDLNELL